MRANAKNLVGERVREIREQMGLYQDELARRLRGRGHKVGRVQIVKLEGGTRFVSDAELVSLSHILRTTPHELLGFTVEEKR